MKRGLVLLGFIVFLFCSGDGWFVASISSPSVATVSVLAVGGGGGSCSYSGGGAGLVNYQGSISVAAQTYTITIGTPGTAGDSNTNGGNGTTSSFGSLVSAAGGLGANYATKAGGNSASGKTGGTAVTPAGGGGGGDSTNGGNASDSTDGGTGGNGTACSITGTSVYYGAGGFGYGTSNHGSPGLGNTNYGSGADTGGTGAAGYPGVVIISVPLSSGQSWVSSTTGSPTWSIVGSNIVYVFTASGSITFGSSPTGYYALLSTDASLQAWWNYENNLNDSSTKGLTLSKNTGNILYSTTTGKVTGSYALKLDGSTDYINTSPSSAFPGAKSWTGTSFTVCIRGYFADISSGQMIMYLSDGSTYYPFTIYFTGSNATHLTFRVQDSGESYHSINSYATMSINTEYAFILQWDGSYLKIFSDVVSPGTIAEDDNATPVACASMKACVTANQINIAGFGGALLLANNSFLDDMPVFSRTLTTNEMQSYVTHGTNCSR
jgi:hypothetical protein